MMVQADVFSLVLTCGVIGLICRDRRCPRNGGQVHLFGCHFRELRDRYLDRIR